MTVDHEPLVPQTEERQAGRGPTLVVDHGRLADDQHAPHPKEGSATLGGRRRRAERAGDDHIGIRPERGITTELLGPPPAHGHPVGEAQSLDRIHEELGPPLRSVDEDPCHGGAVRGQHEAGHTRAAAEIDAAPRARGQRSEEGARMVDVVGDVPRP